MANALNSFKSIQISSSHWGLSWPTYLKITTIHIFPEVLYSYFFPYTSVYCKINLLSFFSWLIALPEYQWNVNTMRTRIFIAFIPFYSQSFESCLEQSKYSINVHSMNAESWAFYLSALPTSLVFRFFSCFQDDAADIISSNNQILKKDKEVLIFSSPLHLSNSSLALTLDIFFILLFC